MFLLLSNDDGYLSPGLRHLADALASEVARIAVIAPDRDCSGASHSLTLKRPLTVTEHGAGIWSVDGTPSDCVHLALTGYIDTRPDMVISGINHGANMGEDVLYSGTVAAAFEGHNLGLRQRTNRLPRRRKRLHLRHPAPVRPHRTPRTARRRRLAGGTAMKHALPLALFALLLAACGGGRYHGPTAYDLHGQRGAMRPGGDYIVRPGDTLFGISWRYGLDMQELANWNGISDPNRILVGQRLRTTPPRGVQPKPVYIPQVSSAGQPGWMWPTRGRVISEYAPNTPGGQSLKIGGSRGQPIYAAHDGEVAYVGSGLSGVGRMIIIRHDDVLAAYGYLDNINVKEHQRVQRGQQIASMGISPQSVPALYFETRKGNRTANPYSYIGSTPRY